MKLNFKTTKVYHKIVNAYNTYDWNLERTLDGGFDVVWGRKYKYIINKGGSRSSKTYSLLQYFALIMLKRKDLKITVWRNEKVTCKGTAMEDFKKILLTTDGLFDKFEENKTKGFFRCKSTNAMILFEGGDNDQKVHGLAQHISFFNEASEFGLDVYRQISQRTEETCFFDFNPSKQFWLESFKNNDRAIFMHSTYKDNAFVTSSIIERLEGYLPWNPEDMHLPKEERRPHEKNVANGTASEFHYLVYCEGFGSEKPDLIHGGWRKCKNDLFDMLPFETTLGIDFGSAKPTAVVNVKWDGGRNFYVDQLCYEPIRKLHTDLAETIISKVQGCCDYEEVESVCDSAKKSYMNDLTNGGFQVIPAKKGNDSIQRGNDKIDEYNIYVTERSKDIHEEQENYTFLKDRYGLATDKPDPHCEDHLMDAIRYAVEWICRSNGL